MPHKNSSTRLGLLMIVSLVTLSACGNVRPDPSPPPELIAREPLGPPFSERMQDFLGGKLPEPTDSEQP